MHVRTASACRDLRYAFVDLDVGVVHRYVGLRRRIATLCCISNSHVDPRVTPGHVLFIAFRCTVPSNQHRSPSHPARQRPYSKRVFLRNDTLHG